jgi:hypothetical protein
MKRSESDQKDLNKGLNLSMMSLVGWIIPIVGLVLAIVATRLAYGVEGNSKSITSKKQLILGVSIAGAMLSIAAGFFYYTYYTNMISVAKQKVQQEEKKANDDQLQQQLKDAEAMLNKSRLTTCLNTADSSYTEYLELNSSNTKVGADGKKIYYLQNTQWDYANGKLKQDQDACYKRYPQ